MSYLKSLLRNSLSLSKAGLACALFVLGPPSAADASVDRSPRSVAHELALAETDGIQIPVLRELDSDVDSTGSGMDLSQDPSWSIPAGPESRLIQVAGRHDDDNDDRRRMERMRRTGPSQSKIRGHDRKIEVRRRAATPIPRVKRNSRRHKGYGYDGRRSRSSDSYSSHHYPSHYYHSVHVHHSHCGHSYWSHGDAFGSRTLGRSCIYGKEGEVIYKPADVICAPDESAEAEKVAPAAAEQSRRTKARPRSRPNAVPTSNEAAR